MEEGERQIMNKYKAFIKYEFRTLKWMMLYFLIVCSGVLLLISGTMEGKRREFLKHSGIWYISNEFTKELSWSTPFLLAGIILGVILLIYVQFRDAKNIEVGRFLKALPMQSSNIYWIRMGCGIITYTIPFILYGSGIIALWVTHSSWLKDLYRISIWQDRLLGFDSVQYIVLMLFINYLIITLVYLMLLLMQYLISNRIFAIVVTAIGMVVPAYFNIMIQSKYQTSHFLTLPVLYGAMDSITGESLMNGEGVSLHFINHSGVKIGLLLLMTGFAIILGWLSSKYFTVEDQSKLIPKRLCRNIFIAVGTLCVALLPQFYVAGFSMVSEVNRIIHLGSIAILGIVGYIVMYKIAMIGCKEK